MDDPRIQLTALFDAYLADTGLSARAFGVCAVGNEHFVRRLKRGTSIRLSTIERALAGIAAHPLEREPGRD